MDKAQALIFECMRKSTRHITSRTFTHTFKLFWQENSIARSATYPCSMRFGSIPKFTRWFGPTEVTSIPPLCTTGHNILML